MNEPTCEQLSEEDGLVSVSREADDSWRHGAYISQVFHRAEDDTYWRTHYRLSSDGETDELREGLASITQVWPIKKTVTSYEARQQ